MNQVRPATYTRETLYTVHEIAAMTGETARAWYYRCAKGVIAHLRIAGSIRVRKSAFDAFMSGCERPAKGGK